MHVNWSRCRMEKSVMNRRSPPKNKGGIFAVYFLGLAQLLVARLISLGKLHRRHMSSLNWCWS